MGIGTDIVFIDRFGELLQKDGFKRKVFTKKEIEYIASRDNKMGTIAGIFAAKEAFLKAIKMGINNFDVKDIEISHDDNNAPYIILHNDIKKYCENKKYDLSISHDGSYAIAIVIIY